MTSEPPDSCGRAGGAGSSPPNDPPLTTHTFEGSHMDKFDVLKKRKADVNRSYQENQMIPFVLILS